MGEIPPAQGRRQKMRTLLDLHGNIPTFLRVTDGTVHDVHLLDDFIPEAGAFYVMDRGYIDFECLFFFTLCSAFFVVRTKENVLLQRRSIPGTAATRHLLRCRNKKAVEVLDQLFRASSADHRSNLQMRWQVELFFKWIKQHLRIMAFYGTSENAVRTQIWIAISIFEKVSILQVLEASDFQDNFVADHNQLILFDF